MTTPSSSHETQGMLLGLVGVLMFSLTLPITHLLVREMNPFLSGLGRALAAAAPAALLLATLREKWPTRDQCRQLAITALGVVVAYPVFSAWAMQTIPASHGAVINGLLPLATASFAAWLAHERPSRSFWIAAVIGSGLIVAFALRSGGGRPQAGDLLMLVAVAIGALGYAQGARLAREMGGWQVICWALVLSAPVLAVPVGALAWYQHVSHPAPLSGTAWLCFAYISLFSQFIGFFAWYAGLARGGIARVSQVQLLQIFFTIALAALFFGEHVPPATWLFGTAVVATVALSRRSAVRHVSIPATSLPHSR